MENAATLELDCIGLFGSWPPLMLRMFVDPKVEIDGGHVLSNWGKRSYTMPAGLHTIEVSYAWLLQPSCNRARLTVELEANRTSMVCYRTNIVTMMPGSLKLIDQLALAKIHKQ